MMGEEFESATQEEPDMLDFVDSLALGILMGPLLLPSAFDGPGHRTNWLRLYIALFGSYLWYVLIWEVYQLVW